MSEEDLREPALLAILAGSLRQMHDCGEELPSTFASFRVVERYAADREGARSQPAGRVRRGPQVRAARSRRR